MGIPLDPPGLSPAAAAKLYPPRQYAWSDTPPALFALDKAIANRATKKCTIVGVGDSLFEGMSASVYGKILLMQLQDQLRGRFPTVGQGTSTLSGGLGYIPAAWPIETSTIAPQEMIPTYSGTVTKATSGTAAWGLGRKYLQLGVNGSVTFKSVVCTGFDIEHLGVVTTGASYTYSIDGGTPVAVSTSTVRATLTAATAIGDTTISVSSVPADWRVGTMVIIETGGNNEQVNIAAIAGTTITLAVALTKTHASAQPVAAHNNGGYLTQVRGLAAGSHIVAITTTTGAFIPGIRYYLNDENSGIHVLNAGHSGIRADQYLSLGAADKWVQSVSAATPAAIVCDLIINDSDVQNPTTYIANLTALKSLIDTDIARKGGDRPSWIQVVPYEVFDSDDRFQSFKWTAYVDALYAWAKADTSGPGGTSGIHVVDLGRRMPRSDVNTGAYGGSGFYLVTDKIHPLDDGCREAAQQITSALPIAQ
ncbi:hypothetical protein [Rhodococcus sp. NPDC006774]|uniref:hypothetical protein n=1 Tax=Rhodococcus sp. NPDC006774 TaxID=3157186 RepID=UPI0033E03122